MVAPMHAPARVVLVPLFLLAACSSNKEEAAPVATSAPPPSITAPAKTATAAPTSAKKPAGADKLSKEDRARFRAAMNEGRTLHRKSDYKGAMAAFEKALALDPDDPRALSELGWAAFFAKDLTLAEAKTKEALKRTRDADLRGSVLYNLGRIAEEQGKKPDASAFYQRSLRERSNATVRERLAKLDPAAAHVFEMLNPRPLAGPYKTLDAFCAANTTRDGVAVKCAPLAPIPETYEGPKGTPGKGPILETRVLWTSEQDGPVPEANVSIHLAIQTKEGWFVSSPVGGTYNPGAFGIFESIQATTLELGDVIPGGAPELTYRFTHDRHDSDMGLNEVESSKTKHLVICGIGASGKPSCTGAIPTEMEASREIMLPDEDEPGAQHEGLYKTRWSLAAAVLPDGQLEIKASGQVPEQHKGLAGKHELRFP